MRVVDIRKSQSYSRDNPGESGYITHKAKYRKVNGNFNHHLIMEMDAAFKLGWIRVVRRDNWIGFQGCQETLTPGQRLQIASLIRESVVDEVLWCNNTYWDDPEERGISKSYSWPSERRAFFNFLVGLEEHS